MQRFKIVLKKGTNKPSYGATLVELMIAVSILVIAAMTVDTFARVAFDYASFHESALTTQDEARRALQLMVGELRQARRPTLTMQTLPNDSVTFQIPEDADGNGLPVDVGGYLESLGIITYMRDMNDMNGDGLTNQLIRVYQSGGSGAAANVTVIANDIMPNEDVNLDGTLNPGEDSKMVFGTVSSNRGHFERSVESLIHIEERWPGWLSRLITRRLTLDKFRDALDPTPDNIKTVIELT